jgi:hypothetical protein
MCHDNCPEICLDKSLVSHSSRFLAHLTAGNIRVKTAAVKNKKTAYDELQQPAGGRLVPVLDAIYELIEYDGMIPMEGGGYTMSYVDRKAHKLYISSAVPREYRDQVIALTVVQAFAVESEEKKKKGE